MEDKTSLMNQACPVGQFWEPINAPVPITGVSLYPGVAVGLDAHVETGGGPRVGPQVDNDGSGGIEPLQRAL